MFILKQNRCLAVQQGCLKSATHDSLVNVHDKTQFTYERMNFVLKESICDTLFPKILKLAVIFSNGSSNLTRTFEFPHKNDDSIFTHKGIINKVQGDRYNTHYKKEETNACFHP